MQTTKNKQTTGKVYIQEIGLNDFIMHQHLLKLSQF